MLRHALTAANTQEAQANLSIQQFALGKTDNVHDVLLAVTKADLAFRMFLEIRNRLTEALQEILRMQV
jgi:flagellar hook-basal body complex protein FliE